MSRFAQLFIKQVFKPVLLVFRRRNRDIINLGDFPKLSVCKIN